MKTEVKKTQKMKSRLKILDVKSSRVVNQNRDFKPFLIGSDQVITIPKRIFEEGLESKKKNKKKKKKKSKKEKPEKTKNYLKNFNKEKFLKKINRNLDTSLNMLANLDKMFRKEARPM
jgi:transaldolase